MFDLRYSRYLWIWRVNSFTISISFYFYPWVIRSKLSFLVCFDAIIIGLFGSVIIKSWAVLSFVLFRDLSASLIFSIFALLYFSTMDHSLENHKTCLNELCRLCGKLVISAKQKKHYPRIRSCNELSLELMMILGLDIKKDNENKHSKFICVKCFTSIKTIKRRQSATSLQNAKNLFERASVIWCDFEEGKTVGDCTSCTHRANVMSGC